MSKTSSEWKLVKTVFEVRFSQPLQDFSFRNKIQRILTGQTGAAILNEAVKYKDIPQKLSVVVQPMRVGVASEQHSISKNLHAITTVVNSLNDELEFGHITRIGFRQMHILEVSSDNYEEFSQTFKNKFLSPSSSLVTQATDVALSLTLDSYKHPLNFNLGPMKGDEIITKGTVNFGYEDVPAFYLMSDLDAFTPTSSMSHKFVKTFLEDVCGVFGNINASISKEWRTGNKV